MYAGPTRSFLLFNNRIVAKDLSVRGSFSKIFKFCFLGCCWKPHLVKSGKFNCQPTDSHKKTFKKRNDRFPKAAQDIDDDATLYQIRCSKSI